MGLRIPSEPGDPSESHQRQSLRSAEPSASIDGEGETSEPGDSSESHQHQSLRSVEPSASIDGEGETTSSQLGGHGGPIATGG